ncbi:JAB domain-containing protein [uncultured Ruminococcus sp.]|uniref:JAB domain-containing protein n=1 Tax=uncultured Ruminococcus sp. TaxID=165186 RepID=UPI00262B9C09|nr:JAB domain-containing protein [uncultured Ruminococcus sp.]
MEKKHSHSGHRGRLRRRFLEAGQDGLYDHELLELMLFYARPVVNTNNIAHSLMDSFGSLGKALSADRRSLSAVKGVGQSGSLFIRLMYDLGVSNLRTAHESERLSDRSRLCACLAEQFKGASARICNILCLSSRSELLSTVTLPMDKILDGEMTAKELAASVLKSGAASVCLGISHGSDLPLPLPDDLALTRLFGELLSAIGVGFTDCIICGGGSSFSMRGSGAFAF